MQLALRLTTDTNNVSILILLNLTAAFSAVHNTLKYKRLEEWTVLSGPVLSSFTTYLNSTCLQSVCRKDILSIMVYHRVLGWVPSCSLYAATG